MNMPAPIQMLPTSGLFLDTLAKNLYATPIEALGELVANGLDAAKIRKVHPVIQIWFWKKGEHPLSPDGPALSVLDNGTGLTPTALEAYCRLGQSVHRGNKRIHGKHGTGKLAPFALNCGKERSFYVTTNTGDVTWMYHLVDVFQPSVPVKVTKSRSKLPTKGPFTEIFIPNLQEGLLTVEAVLKDLANVLNMDEWTIKVQGQELKRRIMETEVEVSTPDIPQLGGVVTMKFGVSEVSASVDTVFLVDQDSLRFVMDFRTVPRGFRAQLDPIFFNPRLMGQIILPGVEGESTSSRNGLRNEFWSTKGRKLAEVLMAHGLKDVRRILGEEDRSKTGLQKAFAPLEEVFLKGFGPPELTTSRQGKAGSKKGAEGEKKGPSSRPSKPESTANLPPVPAPPGGSSPPSSPAKGETYIRIENQTYQVMSFGLQSPFPAEVRKQQAAHFIIINTHNREVARLMKEKAPRAFLEAMVQAVIMAHVLETRGPLSNENYLEIERLKHQVLTAMTS